MLARPHLTQPDIVPIAWRKYRLDERWGHTWKGCRFSIPPGFEHDGASVPQWAWSISGLRPDGLIRAAALLHDALYRYGGEMPSGWTTPKRSFTRKEADTIFYDVMRQAGISKWRAYVAYKAVRMAAGRNWRG